MIVINTHTILHNAILNGVKNLTHRLVVVFFSLFRIALNKKVCLCFGLLEKTIFVQINYTLWSITTFYLNTEMVWHTLPSTALTN